VKTDAIKLILITFFYSCTVHLDTIESFTWEVLIHVSVFYNHYQGATIAKVIIINNQLKYVVYRISSV
jgi:hypothetical protein